MVGAIFTLVGLIFVGVSLVIGQDMARVGGLPLVDATALANTPLGGEVLIEGRISARARPRFREFVAYVRDEYRGNDSDGDAQWVEDERLTPQLLLELADGRVEIVNQDYRLEQPTTSWQESDLLQWSQGSGEGTKRYRGFAAGATVLAIGTAAQGDEFAGISATVLAGGTRSSYLAEQRTLMLVMSVVGGLTAAFGGVLLLVALRPRR